MTSDIELEQLQKFSELLKEANVRWGGLTSSIASMDAIMKTGVRNRKEEDAIYKRILKDRQKEEIEILKAQRAGRMTARETKMALQDLNDRISTVLPDGLKSQFEYMVKGQTLLNRSTLLLNDAVKLATPTVSMFAATAKIVGGTLKSFVDVYQKNSSDISSATQFSTIAFGAITSTVEATGTAIGGAGSAMKDLSTGTSKTSSAIRVFGIGLEFLGGAVKFFGKGLSDLAQSALPILNAELDKVYNSFQQLNSSGAMFANGMTGMIDAATRSNLTLDEFSDVVKNNSDALAKSGMGITAAAQRMSDVSVALRRGGLDRQLLNLGYTYKDQAELVAETMALMRQSGGRLMASDDVVAAQTQKYAENLRIIATITGDDAKAKLKEAQQAANELAFQQKLANMDETTRAGTIEAMASMSDIQRKAFMEQVVFGTQITQETAFAVGNIAGLGDSVNDYVDAFNNGTISAQKSLEIQNQYGDTIKKSVLSLTDLAAAGMAGVSDIASSLKNALQGELTFRNKFTEDATAAAQANLDAQKTGTDKLRDNMLDAAKAARDLKMAIQDELLGEDGAIYGYSKIVKRANEEMLAAINKLKAETGVGKPDNKEPTWFGKISDYLSETKIISKTLGTTAALSQSGAAAAGLTGLAAAPTGIGLVGFETLAAALESTALISGGLGWLADKVGFADGGISKGPDSGYLAKLHGEEAVLPPDLTAMLTEVAQSKQSTSEKNDTNTTIAGLNNQLQRVSNGNDDLMNMLIGKVDQLIDATKSVANYAELTAARVA
jgi:hypothetical protein